MHSTAHFRNRKWLAIAIFAALALLIVVLLHLPLAAVGERMMTSDVARALLPHRGPVMLIAMAVALGLAAWLVVRRHFKLLAVGGGIVVLAGISFGVYKFQQHNPRADLFSPVRLRDAADILFGKDILLGRFQPRSTLVVERDAVTRASYPAIDVHFHLESLAPSVTPERLVKAMDAAGIAKVVNLGGDAETFEHFAQTFRARYPDRFVLFVKPDPRALTREGGVEEQVEWIKRAVRMGARGIKENKSFGLAQRDTNRQLVTVDDPRLDPIWRLAGRLGMPVLIHTSEPPPFFTPVDEHNERFAELVQNPVWSRFGVDGPTHQELMQQRERLLARHPNTNFIGAHMGMNPNDLGYVAELLDRYPNYHVDMSSVVQELGRQPYSARRFFIRYQDRILFGTDGGYGLDPETGWTPERMYRSYLEFLETDNEYIDYPLADITKQGNWRVYGIDLPDEVLEKLYVRNAERLIPTDAAVEARLNEVNGTPEGHQQNSAHGQNQP
jgi:predicted TIM-barrel fold metal-dependent hydrolase